MKVVASHKRKRSVCYLGRSVFMEVIYGARVSNEVRNVRIFA